MLEIQYIGEHLWPGKLGHILVLTAFTSLLYAFAAYAYSTRHREWESASSRWKKAANIAWTIHSVSIFSAIGLIFYIMSQRWYEYSYVFEHVNDALSMRYILSAFWEGQEGSFLLWMFWHIVLGHVLIARAGRWVAPVMAVMAMVQLIICSMILGVHFPIPFQEAYAKMGSSPFVLLREIMDIPLFRNASYLTAIEGKGLNALLQNYWMTIHPPTLFLGFASMTVPYAYAVAGLWTGDHKAWLRPCLRWSLFGAGIIGIGILMGAAWAYEALSFGGYWSWDPVENTSFVPWLLLVAGIHVNLIATSTGYSIRASYIFYLLVFIATVYSTLLTRSGVLGDSSAHAFTEMGLEAQLLFFLGASVLAGVYFLLSRWQSIPSPEKEEDIRSKEFWMFIGSLVLLMSSILISFTTSIPVYNKIAELFGYFPDWSEPLDREAHHNQYQIWIAILIGLLSGLAQYLRYREFQFKTYRSRFLKHLGITLGVSVLITILAELLVQYDHWVYILALFAAIYTIISNLMLIFSLGSHRTKQVASILSHVGFGLMLIGILQSGINKTQISKNEFAQRGLIEDGDPRKSIMLLKDIPMFMKDWWVTYRDEELIGNRRNFHLQFERKNDQGEVVESHDLYPYVLYTNDFSEVASTNPFTLRYWNKDIFTTISRLPEALHGRARARALEDSIQYKPMMLTLKDTMTLGDYLISLRNIDQQAILDTTVQRSQDRGVQALIHILDTLGRPLDTLKTGILLRDEFVYDYPAQAQSEKLRVKLDQEILQRSFPSDSELAWDTVSMERGGVIYWNDHTIRLTEVFTDSARMSFQLLPGDIAVGASLNVSKAGHSSEQINPVFLIRSGRPNTPRILAADAGLWARFVNINPDEELLQFALAKAPSIDGLVVNVAQDVPRTDLVVIETIVFPGINLVWLGGTIMMLGLLWGAAYRYRRRQLSSPQT